MEQQIVREAGAVVTDDDRRPFDGDLDRAGSMAVGVDDEAGDDPFQAARIGLHRPRGAVGGLRGLGSVDDLGGEAGTGDRLGDHGADRHPDADRFLHAGVQAGDL